MKKLFLLFGLFALLLTSCTPNSSYSSVTNESDVLVMKTIETNANDGSVVTTDYTYSGKKLVKSTDSDGVYENYTYTGDLISSVKAYDGTNTLMTQETFTYNGSGLLVTYLVNDFGSDHGRKEEFVYNSDGTVSYTVYGGDNTTQTTLKETGTIHSTAGEVTQIDTVVTSPAHTASRVYTYDTKNNPFKNVTGYDKLNFITEEAIGVTHNILTDHYTSTLGANELNTLTYTYNSLNFPLTDSDITGTDATSIITTQYFYN